MKEVKERNKGIRHWDTVQTLAIAAMVKYNPQDFEDLIDYINSPESQNYNPKYEKPVKTFKTATNWFYQNKKFLQSEDFPFFYDDKKTAKGFLKALAQLPNFNKGAFKTQVFKSLNLASSA